MGNISGKRYFWKNFVVFGRAQFNSTKKKMWFKRATYMLTFLFLITKPEWELKKGLECYFFFPPKQNFSGEVGKTDWNWLKTAYLNSIVFLLPRVPSSEYSSGFSTCPGYRAQCSSECLQLWTSFLRQPSKSNKLCCTSCSHSGEVRLASSGSQYQQQDGCSQTEAVHSDVTSLAVPRTWVLSPHDTKK